MTDLNLSLLSPRISTIGPLFRGVLDWYESGIMKTVIRERTKSFRVLMIFVHQTCVFTFSTSNTQPLALVRVSIPSDRVKVRIFNYGSAVKTWLGLAINRSEFGIGWMDRRRQYGPGLQIHFRFHSLTAILPKSTTHLQIRSF